MATINNPFVMYGYKGAEYFCDREKETEKMMTSLHNERNITLVAPRRMGKTGLIHHVFQQLEKQYDDVKCFYLDIFATKNLEQMVQLMASKIATFSLDLKPNEGRESLKRIFEYMKQSGKRCYVAIDEFQQIMNYPEDGVEALIRSYIQFLPNVYFVFSGSQQHMMEEMFLSANRPFFQSSLVMSLPCIAESRYLSFANRLLSSQKREVDVDTFTYIYSQADSVTWYVQAILHGIYEHRDEQINKDLVDEVIQELIEEQAMAYQNYCAWLTENQQLLLLAIAKEQIVSSPLSQQFITHHLPATSSVKTALKALVDKQLISKTPKGFFVSDRFFAKWLAKG